VGEGRIVLIDLGYPPQCVIRRGADASTDAAFVVSQAPGITVNGRSAMLWDLKEGLNATVHFRRGPKLSELTGPQAADRDTLLAVRIDATLAPSVR
jgi:hypothetical protein